MKRKFFDVLLVVLLVLSFTTSSFAIDEEKCNGNTVKVLEIPPFVTADQYFEINRGVNIPTTEWDLSEADYSGSFNLVASVLTNRVFTGHNGSVYVNLTTTSANTNSAQVSNYTVRVYLCKKGLFDSITYLDSAVIPVNTTRQIQFTGHGSGGKYFIQFSQPSSQQSYVLTGSFTVTTP